MHEQRLVVMLAGLVQHGAADDKLLHKRLVLAYAMARVARGEPRLFRFEDAEQAVATLITRFAPAEKSPARPEYPLYRLVNDADGELWEISQLAELRARENSKGQPPITALRKVELGFTLDVDALLRGHPDVLRRMVAVLLVDLAVEVREGIGEAVGLGSD